MGFVAKLDMTSTANFALIGAALGFLSAIVAGIF
jgi:hypothetical protein